MPGEFPGPVIEARSGDEIVVEVHNGLDDEDIAIHWHGLSMRGKLLQTEPLPLLWSKFGMNDES